MLVTLTLALGLCAPAASNDGNVEWDGLFHDGSRTFYVPNGPRPSLADDVVVNFRTFQFDVTEVELRWWDGAMWHPVPMAFAMDLPTTHAECPLSTPCVLWVGTIPGGQGALAYAFRVTDMGVSTTDVQHVVRATAGPTSRVLDDGMSAAPGDAWVLPLPDAGSAPDASTGVPDASTGPLDSGAPRPDASTPAPDASVNTADASVSIPDASTASPDASSNVPDAAVFAPDASSTRPDASTSQPDASQPVQDGGARADAAASPDASSNPGTDAGGACVPGCRSTSERVACSTTGRPLVLACTAGTECSNGQCVTPAEEPPQQQGCGCHAPSTGNAAGFLALVALWMARRRRG